MTVYSSTKLMNEDTLLVDRQLTRMVVGAAAPNGVDDSLFVKEADK
jgi:hypothetical protein